MPRELIRIVSDIHYGDRASRVERLAQLAPLMSGIDRLVVNGDATDTRPGPRPRHTEACRHDIEEFARSAPVPITWITGNHDPDISAQHSLDLAKGEVFVVHGDVLFDDIVPWGRDAATIRRRIAEALGTGRPSGFRQPDLDSRLKIWRRVSLSIPQRHQSERRALRYALHFAVDTVWPPSRFLRIFHAWRVEASRAAALAVECRPQARCVLLGHTHRPSITRFPEGPTVINTGSFCGPFGGYAVDIEYPLVRVCRIERRGEAFHPGMPVSEFLQ